ncbi:hypothetical protein RRG08_031415 [Elysia crispata]|uniref:Uncharacterized protein n=1 Tax=Elysia crispata TaxID=231223 RepID=A0AAE0ZP35_9GAST|nr:hypothetical protein RRG08_031415 [Elysia crispata]
MKHALPHFRPFIIREEEPSAGTRWKKCLSKFENLVTAMDITSEVRKKALLVHYKGDEIYDLIDTFPAASRETNASFSQKK